MDDSLFLDIITGILLALFVIALCSYATCAHDKDQEKVDRIHTQCVKNGNTWTEGNCIPGIRV